MRRVNQFVYDETFHAGLPPPSLPVFLVEHYGQCAEDIIVAALLRAEAKRKSIALEDLSYLEIGGNHPFATSATFLLNKTWGMRGVIVEANRDLIPDLERTRPHDKILFAAVTNLDAAEVSLIVANASELSSTVPGFVESWKGERGGVRETRLVPNVRVNDVIKQHLGGKVAFLSIDVEGMDFEILRDLDLENAQPFVIQIEPSDHLIEGNSEQITKYMERNGYRLAAMTDVNLIFVRLQPESPTQG